MSRERALQQSMQIQEAVLDHLHTLTKTSQIWALMGGSTEDDGMTLRVTLCLETRYATKSADQQHTATDPA